MYWVGSVPSKPDGIDPEPAFGAKSRQLITVWTVVTPRLLRSSSVTFWSCGSGFWRSLSSWKMDSCVLLACACPVYAIKPAASESAASITRTDGNKERRVIVASGRGTVRSVGTLASPSSCAPMSVRNTSTVSGGLPLE